MGKRFALVMLLGLVVLTGCSTSEDISSMEISEVIVKVQTALNKLSKEEIHTQEKTTMTYPGGADTVEVERWYANGNCLYIGKQSNGITTTRLQYGDKVYSKTSLNENWSQAKETESFVPFGVNQSTAEQFSENTVTSRKVENDEYCVIFEFLPQTAVQNYTKNQVSLFFTEKWELLRVETHAEYSMESWVDGSSTEIISDAIIEYQDTSAKQIKKQIKDTYADVCE